MKVGFACSDITPRVGVELCGFGPFLNRHSTGVHDPLTAKAMAIDDGATGFILVACDIVAIPLAMTQDIRARVAEQTGISPGALMICCSHTHSGPTTFHYEGWGDPDPPYLHTLPGRIAHAATEAWERREEASFGLAAVPCTGIAINREYDRHCVPPEEALVPGWAPDKPELTDTTCHVVTAHSDRGLIGFFSHFSCHPVVCCEANTLIHGDFVGLASNEVARENDCIGLFVQGAQGDVNSCIAHESPDVSMKSLAIIADRYATCLRQGIAEAKPIDVDTIRHVAREPVFSRIDWDEQKLRELLHEKQRRLETLDAHEGSHELRLEMVLIGGLERMLRTLAEGGTLRPATQIQGLKLGPVALLGSGFEVFQAINNEIVSASEHCVTLVAGLTNDAMGYATDRDTAARGGYAQQQVPLMGASLAYARIHDELRDEMIALSQDLTDHPELSGSTP
ncbi:MAG: hypothetical protein HN712_01525 [Gemmatimonadetes bacterium]|jgi:hypothetical protein|nr:hypothetical protein [Gemmatimonadota bacterium]MBT6147550.1 hypothetical protein [Gemmatimonadota bacterium]MBT7858953.1 hypothetical protein [Gemmatimonadota bacterium]